MEQQAKSFLYNFFQKNYYSLFEVNYMQTKMFQGKIINNKEQAISIYGKRIKDAYKFFISKKTMNEIELENCLRIMILENLQFTYKQIENTNKAIKIGLYDEELNILKDKEEEKMLFETLDWGVEGWG